MKERSAPRLAKNFFPLPASFPRKRTLVGEHCKARSHELNRSYQPLRGHTDFDIASTGLRLQFRSHARTRAFRARRCGVTVAVPHRIEGGSAPG